MARKTRTLLIGKSEYEITQLPAVEGHELYNELMSAIGPVLKERGREAAKKEKLDPEEAGFLFMECKRQVSRELMRELRNAFRRNSKVRIGDVFLELSEDGIFDQHFAGKMQELDQWLMACGKFNFMSFLSAAEASAVSQVTG